MNEVARELIGAAAQWFGDGAFSVEANDSDSEAMPGSVLLIFSHPNRSHRLEILQRTNTFEVAYSDGTPPGPAEQLFVYSDPSEIRDVVQEVIAFVASILAGNVIALRERLSLLGRFLRGRDCDSLLSFAAPEAVTDRKRRRLVALYKWSAG